MLVVLLAIALAVSIYVSKIAYSDAATGDGDGTILLDEDFQNFDMGDFPAGWNIESAGYGLGGIYVEDLVFEPGNRVLHAMSASNRRAVLTHNITVETGNISVCLSVKVTEKERFPEIDDPVALSVGFETDRRGKISLVSLGRGDNQTVLPFGKWYPQDAWLPVCVRVNLANETASVYIWQKLQGTTQIGNLTAGTIRSLYLELGGGAWYVGRFDNIKVSEYPVDEGLDGPILALVLVPVCARLVGRHHSF